MARVPEHVKEEVRQRIHLPDLLMESGVELRRQGRSMRGLCPFEADTSNRSKFSVTDNFYHCFGCGEQGDVFDWLQQRRGLSFRDALEEAAGIAGMDITQYTEDQGPDRDPERSARLEVMAALAELSREVARELDEDRRRLGALDLDPLIESGEIGLLPSAEEVMGRLTRIGTSETARRQVGLEEALESVAGQWMLWARSKQAVWAGRPLAKSRPVIGERGLNRSSGWVHGEEAPRESRLAEWFGVAGDDELYVRLRAAGLPNLFRALTKDAYDFLRPLPMRGSEPVLLVRPEKRYRKWAYRDGLRLLSAEPRLRALEREAPQAPPGDRDAWREELDAAVEDAGTLFDWQCELMARYGALEDERGRQAAAGKLARIVRAVETPIERLAYRQEAERLLGQSLDPLLPDGDSGGGLGPRNSRRPRSSGTAVTR